MKLNTTIAMGLITLATLSFTACGDSKNSDATKETAAAPAADAPAASGPVIRVLDGNGAPIATAGITILITSSDNSVINLKTGADGTVALPADKVKYPATVTAESEGHTYTRSRLLTAADIHGNKIVILQN